MSREIEIVKEIIITYLNKNINLESANELYDITHGDKQVLYSHIKALSNIFAKAKEQLEKELLEKEGK